MDHNPYAAATVAGSNRAEIDAPQSMKIKRIGILRTALWASLTVGTVSLLGVPLVVTVMPAPPAAPAAFIVGMAIGLVLSYTVMGFVAGLVAALVFNACAGVLGGVTVELE